MNTEKADPDELEGRIAAWRARVYGASDPDGAGLEDLEASLAGQFAALRQTGLDADEAFLIALKRVGERHAPTREFLVEVARRVLGREAAHPPGAPAGDLAGTERRETLVVFGLAALAAVAIRLPELFGFPLADGGGVYLRNLSLFVFPCLAGYFGWKRGLEPPSAIRVGLAFVAAAVLVNAFPFAPEGATESLAALHLPIALWMAVGVAYAGGRWNSTSNRLKFVRFSGELFIHCVLIALGGVVLIGLTLLTFRAIGVDAEWLVEEWVLPSGALGAIVVSGWLADTKASVAGNMAPMLTRIFTPLFAAVLITFLLTMAWAGTGIRMEREVLIGFDLLLVVVVGLVLYAVAARSPAAPPGVFAGLQLVLVISALAADALALGAIGARISEFGFSANRTAALGINLILFANLAGSAWLYLQFLRRRGSGAALERWQTAFLPVYAGWAAVVVAVFPLLFGYR